MHFAKRIVLFLALNFLVLVMISLVLSIFDIRPYLTEVGLDYSSLMIFCLIWGMGGALISLALSKVMAKWMMGVTVIDPATHDPQLKRVLETVHTLCHRAGIPLPEVGIYRSKEVNAFATGPTRSRSLVAVSSGLLERMNQPQLEAILGHEVTHIANGDMVTMTLLQGVINAFVLFLSRVFAYALSGLGKNRQGNQGGSYASFYVLTIVFEIVFMLLGSLVVAAYSRYREFRADAGGARLAGKDSMIGALQTLQNLQEIRDPKENPAMAAFKISHPSKKGLLRLFASHPPLEERIERLQQYS